MMGGSAATTCKLEYNINITKMKQILSLWDACPQGGKHRRSVFLRLLLLVCMLATASAGWATDQTYTINSPSANANTDATSGITVIGTKTTAKIDNTSSQAVFSAKSSQPLYITSVNGNIKGIQFDYVDSSSGSGTENIMSIFTSTGAALAAPTTGFTASYTPSGGAATSVTSLTGIAVPKDQSTHYTFNLTLTSAVSTIVVNTSGSNAANIRNLVITYDDAITAPSLYATITPTGTNTYTVTGSGSMTASSVNNTTQTISSSTYYQLNSSNNTYTPAESLSAGDIVVYTVGNTSSKNIGINTESSGALNVEKGIAGQPYQIVYVVPSAKSTLTFTRNSSDTYLKDVKVYHNAATPTPSIAFNNPTTSVTVGSTVTNTATLTNASGSTITYSSDDTNVATVDSSTGEVTGVAAGTATITATYTESSVDYTATYTITVSAAPADPTFTYGGSAQAAGSTISSGVHTGDVVTINVETDKYIYADWSSSDSQGKPYAFTNGKSRAQTTYQATITSGGTRVLYAVAGVNSDGTGASSDLALLTFTGVTPQDPTFSVAEGSVAKNTSLTLTAGYNEDNIYYTYTTDGSEPADPTTSSTPYSSALNIFTADNTTYKIKAVAYDKTDANPSAVITKTYTTPAAAVLTAESNKTWDFTSSTQFDQASSADYTFSSYTVTDNIGIGENTVLKKVTTGDSGKPQRLMLSGNNTSSSANVSATKESVHFKVAGHTKITVNAVGGSSRNIKIESGSFGTGTALLSTAATSSSRTNFSAYYNGDTETDIYVYESTGNGNITLYSITVEPTYALTKGTETNGTFTLSPSVRAAAGESVTVTTSPATGYEVGSVTTTPTTSVATTTLNTTYTFTMPASDVTVDVNFIASAAPALAISTQPVGASYNQNATATALTVAAENGTAPYTYQWYSNTTSSTSGASEIIGATNSSYTPSTATVGTTYYYCKVTDAASATVNSTIVAITVKGASESPANNPAVVDKSGTSTYGNFKFLDVANTASNAESADGSIEYLTYTKDNIVSMNPAWYTGGTSNTGSISGSYNSSTMSGFLSWSGSLQAFSVQAGSGYQRPFYVTGTSGVAILGTDNSSSDASKRLRVIVEEVAADGSLSTVGTDALGTNTTSAYVLEHASTLDPSKFYKVTVCGLGSSNSRLGQIRFTKGTATPVETYTVTCTTGLEHGSISSNVADAAEGTSVTITATPAAGYVLNTVTVTKAGSGTVSTSGTGNTRTFTMPADAVTVTATFKTLPTITTSATNGTVTTSPASYAAEGTTVTITATPASGYALDAITVTDGDDNPVTVTSNQFTMPNSNVTVTATFVESQVAAGDRWNFTTMNSTDDASYTAASEWNSTTSNNKPIYGNAFTASKGSYASYSTTNIEQIYGMQFGRMSGGSLSSNNIKIFKPTSSSATDGYLQLDASAISIKLPSQAAGTKLHVYGMGSSTKGFTLENATAEGDATKITGENIDAEITVTATGAVVLTTESSGFKIYKIVVGDVVDVAEPTFSKVDGDGYDGTPDPLEVTVQTNQALNDGTSVTTYWAYSTAAMTRAQIVAANNGFTTNTGTASISAANINQSNIVLSAVTQYVKGGNTYYSEVVSATYPYTGVKTSNLTVDHLDIQYGEERTLKPVFKYNDGTEFDPSDDDIHSSINDYFDFTFTKTTSASPYISVDANGVVKTKDASGNRAEVGTTETFSITATKKSTWNDSTDGPWPFDNTNYSTTATITVIQKTSGFHMSFYWDPEYQHEVDPSEYNLGTDDESSVTIFSEKMYNGRMFYAKPEEGYTIYVAAGINSGSVSNVSSNSKKNGVNYYKYTFNDTNDEFPDAPIEYNGMPILIEDDEWGGADEKFFYLNFHTYNNSTKTFEGSPVKAKFTVMKDNTKRPDDVTLAPSTNSTPMSTAETVAVIGEDGAYVYGKFSSSGTSYTIPNLINEKGILGGVSSVAVFSTEVAQRKISATQVKKESEGHYYIGNEINLTYTYRFATELNLTSNSYHTTVYKGSGDKEVITLSDLIKSITYYNKDSKADIDITDTESNVEGGTTDTQKETVEIVNVTFRNGADGTNGTVYNESAGTITIGQNSGSVIVTFRYPGGTYEKTVNKRKGVTATTTETYTIYITDPSEQIPNITPPSRNFNDGDEVSVRIQAPSEWDVLYMVVPANDPNFNAASVKYTSEGTDKNCYLIEHGKFVMLTVNETSQVRAFAFDPEETSTTSKEVSETYTKLPPLQAPVLSPYGEPHVRTTKDLTVNVTLKDAISGLEVYYTTDGTDPTPTTGELFNGSEKIKISGASTTVKAIAYEPSTGRISPIASGVYVYTSDLPQPVFYVSSNNGSSWDEGHTSGTVTVHATDRVKITGPAGATIFYSLDGSTPTPGASREFDTTDPNAPFLIMKNTVGRALAIEDDASSAVTTVNFVLAEDNENLWEAVEETTPSGKMAANDRYVVYGKSEGNSSTKAVKYLTATFGGKDNAGWSHADISESTKGTPLDGVGEYSIRNNNDAWDETGKETQNNSEVLHERTFKLPAQGDMVRFEPERDGELTIWLLQQGGLNYTDDGEFCDKFIRLRPVYLFDEQGNSIAVSENRGIKSSARLSSNWDELKTDAWTPKNSTQNGVTNIYYTPEESNKIYAMYNTNLNGKGAGDAIEPFEVPDGDVKNLLSGLGLTGHGYVMPSGGYVRYNFNVKGGKTYYLFGYRTKLGVRGFRFQPTSEEVTTNVTMADDKNDALSAISSAGTNICNVTYSRTFTSGTWAALVLPFSVSRTQLQKVFGDNVDVLHLEKTTAHSMEFKRHWYPMIVAGTPILIKPSKTVTPVFEGVHKEATAVTDVVPSEGAYMMTGSFTQGNLVKGDYYVATDGSIKYLTSESASSKSCRSWFTPKPGQSARASLMMGATDAFAEEVWNVAGNPQPFVASDETVVTYINGVQEDGIINNIFDGPTGIYTINGQLIRKDATSLEGLPKGIYIVNGKKVAVK